jgi:hypothetical protein
MKISSLHHKIKDAAPILLHGIALTVLLSGAGCVPVIAEAPFSARPDTVEAGDLAGPFDGRVIDSSTGHPLAGALVFASWGLEVGDGLTAPAGAVTATVETDSDGRYDIDRLHSWPGRRTRVTRFTLLVYKRGYIGYRSDRRFDDLGTRHDFSQSGNQVKLERYPQGLSHVRHVRFLGGYGPLRTALASEFVQASLELSGQAPAVESAQPALLDASGLLTADELKAVTGYSGTFTLERLGDLPQSASYDSKHFRADGKPESYDAAIRVWRLAGAQAADGRWAQVVKEVPHAETGHEAGDLSLKGYDGRILAAAVVEKSKGLVVELTCGVDLCRDTAQAMALLRRVLGRAERLGGEAAVPVSKDKPEAKPPEEKAEKPPEAEKPEETKPEEPKPDEDRPFQLKEPGLHR